MTGYSVSMLNFSFFLLSWRIIVTIGIQVSKLLMPRVEGTSSLLFFLIFSSLLVEWFLISFCSDLRFKRLLLYLGLGIFSSFLINFTLSTLSFLTNFVIDVVDWRIDCTGFCFFLRLKVEYWYLTADLLELYWPRLFYEFSRSIRIPLFVWNLKSSFVVNDWDFITLSTALLLKSKYVIFGFVILVMDSLFADLIWFGDTNYFA